MPTKYKPDGREVFLAAGLYMIYQGIALDQGTIEPKISVQNICRSLGVSHILVIRLRRTLIDIGLIEESQFKGHIRIYPPVKYERKKDIKQKTNLHLVGKYRYVQIHEYIKGFLKTNGAKPTRINKRISPEVKELMDYWYSFPRSTKNKRGSKTYNNIIAHLQQLLDGTFGTNNNLSKQALEKSKIPKEWLNKKWGVNEIKEGLKRLSLISKTGFWFDNPSSYYKNLSGLLYNYHSASSFFLQVMKENPKPRGTKIKPSTERIKLNSVSSMYYLSKIIEEVVRISSNAQRIKLNQFIKDIKKFHTNISFENKPQKLFDRIGTVGKFCKQYLIYVQSQDWVEIDMNILNLKSMIFKKFLKTIEDDFYDVIKF